MEVMHEQREIKAGDWWLCLSLLLFVGKAFGGDNRDNVQGEIQAEGNTETSPELSGEWEKVSRGWMSRGWNSGV